MACRAGHRATYSRRSAGEMAQRARIVLTEIGILS